MFLAEGAPSGLNVTDLTSALLAYGPGGLMLALVVFGLLVPRGQLTDMRKDRDEWKMAYMTERDARIAAERRADVAVEQGRTTVAILDEAGHQPGGNGVATT